MTMAIAVAVALTVSLTVTVAVYMRNTREAVKLAGDSPWQVGHRGRGCGRGRGRDRGRGGGNFVELCLAGGSPWP